MGEWIIGFACGINQPQIIRRFVDVVNECVDGFANNGRTDGFGPANILVDWLCRLGEISIRQDESHLPEMRKHYNTFVGGWLVVHAETRCVCVCAFVLLVLRAAGDMPLDISGEAQALCRVGTPRSRSLQCAWLPFGVLTTYLTSQSFQKVRVDALRAEGASQQVEWETHQVE